MIRTVSHIIGTVLLLGLIVAGCSSPGDPPPAPPASPTPDTPLNLVMVSLDTLRADRLGCYGYPLPTSPFMDALSRHTVQAVDVLAQNPSTIRSHRAIFTGRYIYQHGKGPAPAETTLAGRLAAAGYATGAFTDGGLMNAQYGNNPGFQQYNDDGGGFSRVMDRGFEWLDNLSEQPFFMFLHTYDIHYPYTPPEPFADMFLPEGDPPYHLGADHGQHYWNDLDLERDEFIWISRRYDGGIRATDQQMQRLWLALRDRGRLADTIFIVVSDHGESLGERLFVGHRQLYDVQLQVPLLVFIPNHAARIMDGAVETVDILPTLVDILALPRDETLPGRSMVRAMAGLDSWLSQRPRLSETWARAFREDTDWKFILREDADRDELYRLRQDPEENRNVAVEYPEKTAALREALSRFTGIPVAEIRQRREQRQIPVLLRANDETGREDTLMDQLRKLGYVQ